MKGRWPRRGTAPRTRSDRAADERLLVGRPVAGDEPVAGLVDEVRRLSAPPPEVRPELASVLHGTNVDADEVDPHASRRSDRTIPSLRPERPMHRRTLAGSAVGVAFAVLAVALGTAGALPAPVQRLASNTASVVGVDIPTPHVTRHTLSIAGAPTTTSGLDASSSSSSTAGVARGSTAFPTTTVSTDVATTASTTGSPAPCADGAAPCPAAPPCPASTDPGCATACSNNAANSSTTPPTVTPAAAVDRCGGVPPTTAPTCPVDATTTCATTTCTVLADGTCATPGLDPLSAAVEAWLACVRSAGIDPTALSVCGAPPAPTDPPADGTTTTTDGPTTTTDDSSTTTASTATTSTTTASTTAARSFLPFAADPPASDPTADQASRLTVAIG